MKKRSARDTQIQRLEISLVKIFRKAAGMIYVADKDSEQSFRSQWISVLMSDDKKTCCCDALAEALVGLNGFLPWKKEWGLFNCCCCEGKRLFVDEVAPKFFDCLFRGNKKPHTFYWINPRTSFKDQEARVLALLLAAEIVESHGISDWIEEIGDDWM